MWIQNVDPAGHIVVSAGLAVIPIVFLFWALAVRRLKGHVAGLLTVLAAVLVAVAGFGMPLRLAVFSTLHGAAYGLFPIGWIVVAAVFLYKLTVRTGQFDVIKESVASITEDRRVQALLIAFSFGAFLEGAAGFGTPVAISAAMLVGDWGMRPVRAILDMVTAEIPFPVIHNTIVNPVTGHAVPSLFRFNWLSATGTAIVIAALISATLSRIHWRDAFEVFGSTLKTLRFPLATIASVLGFAYIGNASGITTTLGMALASTGPLFPFFSPFLGWLGVFMTGSDTSANAVFGRLQTVSAERLGISPVLAIAANSSGGVTGKMISPQSIAVACGATGLVGQEAALFRFTVWHSMALATVLGALTLLQARVLTWMIPIAPPSGGLATVARPADPAAEGWLILLATAAAVAILGWAVRRQPSSRAGGHAAPCLLGDQDEPCRAARASGGRLQ